MKLQRIQKIEGYIKQHGSASLDDLCGKFQVSKNTIRRYVSELESRNIVKKVYGGVVLKNGEAPIPLSQRQMSMRAEKVRIAQKAAEFVHDGDVVIVDAGSTTVHVIDFLRNKQNVTIITNSVPVLNAASPCESFHVIVTGGDLYRPTNSFVGPDAIGMLKKLNAKTLFLAATGVSLTKGITNSSTIESEIKRTMIAVSEQIILLVDHTKFDTVSLVTFADLADIDILVTDNAPPTQYFQYCVDHEAEIIVAH